MQHRSLGLSRRELVGAAAQLPLLGAAPSVLRGAEPDLAGLSDITTAVPRIGREERTARLARAQALMKANGIGAIIVEPGSSMIYFTGVD
ncbi:hypothetical protein ACSTKO_24935, partial [Vibrio parahaemolyticus]